MLKSENLGIIYCRNKKNDTYPNTIKIYSAHLWLERISVFKTSERDFINYSHEI